MAMTQSTGYPNWNSVKPLRLQVILAEQAAEQGSGRNGRRRAKGPLAELLHEVSVTRAYRNWGFETFEEYVAADCEISPRLASSIVRTYQVLVVKWDVPVERVERIGWSKATLITPRALSAWKGADSDTVDQLLVKAEQLPIRRLRDAVRAREGGLPEGGPQGQGTRLNAPLRAAVQEAERRAILSEIAAQIRMAPAVRWPPRPQDFVVSRTVWRQVGFAIQLGKNALLLGPSGSGKTELLLRTAAAHGRKIECFNMGAMSEPRTTLIGQPHLDASRGDYFEESRFVRALRTPGCCILLDELSRAQRDAFNILLPLLDGQRYLALDEAAGAPTVSLAEGVSFVATANEGNGYTGADRLDKAIKDRFAVVVPMWFPSVSLESQLLVQRKQIELEKAVKLCKAAQRQRQLWREGEFNELISTRCLLEAAEQMACGIGDREAIEFTIENHFSDEGGEMSDRTRLKQLLQKTYCD